LSQAHSPRPSVVRAGKFRDSLTSDDGNVDILWRNDITGQVATWKLDKTDPATLPDRLKAGEQEIVGIGFNA
jgi:hypothetical protein